MAERGTKDGGQLTGCLVLGSVLVGAALTLVASIALAVLAQEPTFDRLGPWLARQTGWERAAIGLGAGAVLALPVLLAAPRRTRRWLGWPVAFYLFTAWIHMCITWLPPRRGRSGVAESVYRAEADWYIVTSILAFHLALVALPLLAHRWGRRSPVGGDDRDLTAQHLAARSTTALPVPPSEAWSSAFLEDMHRAAVEELWLFEVPLGAPGGHGPWAGDRCAAQLLRWFDAGLITLYQDDEWQAPEERDLTDTGELDAARARELLQDPQRWTEDSPDGFVCVSATDEGGTAPVQEWRRA